MTIDLSQLTAEELQQELDRRTGNHPDDATIETYQDIYGDIVSALDNSDLPAYNDQGLENAEWIQVRAGVYQNGKKKTITTEVFIPLITKRELIKKLGTSEVK